MGSCSKCWQLRVEIVITPHDEWIVIEIRRMLVVTNVVYYVNILRLLATAMTKLQLL